MNGAKIVGVGLDGLVLRSDDEGLSFKAQIRPQRVDLTATTGGDREQTIAYSRRGAVALRCDGASPSCSCAQAS